ncbi:MAG: tetratricopeptide repeat protein [Enhygromyxa sp.]
MDQQPQQPSDLPPDLRRFVEAAREQPIVGTCVSAEAVAAGLERKRQHSQARRTALLSGALAVAASLVAVGLLWPLLSGSEDQRRESSTLEQRDDAAKLDEPSGGDEPILASAVRVRSTASLEVRDAWSVVLGEGVHEIEVDAREGHALMIELPGRKLELIAGSLTVEVVEGSPAVRLHNGVAAWIDEHDQRTSISVERLELEPEPADPSAADVAAPSAATLAREADLRLEAGKREQAIELYRQLVRKHPRASQSRAALLDLARLLRSSGRPDEARCAYQLYLERWPKSAVRGEVEAQLRRLGEGPRCRGLSPASR